MLKIMSSNFNVQASFDTLITHRICLRRSHSPKSCCLLHCRRRYLHRESIKSCKVPYVQCIIWSQVQCPKGTYIKNRSIGWKNFHLHQYINPRRLSAIRLDYMAFFILTEFSNFLLKTRMISRSPPPPPPKSTFSRLQMK